MANNISVKDASASTQVLKTTDTAGVHTPHHLVDGTVAVTDNGGSLTVDGTVELGATSLSALENIQVTFPSTQNVSVQNASLAVTGTFWQTTQPVSGTVTANAGTNLNTSALALESTATSIKTAVETLDNAISGNEMQVDIVSSAAIPVTDNGGSLTVDGSVSVSNFPATQPVSGTVTAAQATAANLKAQVQVLDSSGTQLTYGSTGTAGTPSADVVTVQGISNGVAFTAAQATAANLNATVVQSTATNLRTQAESYQGGTAVGSGNPLQVTLANTGANTTALRVEPKNGAVTCTTGDTATANTSKQALASGSSRRYLLIQNISDTDMYFNFGATATTDNMLIAKNGGGIVFESGYVPTDAVNVICSGANKKYFILSA